MKRHPFRTGVAVACVLLLAAASADVWGQGEPRVRQWSPASAGPSATIDVAAGGDLQAALDGAQPGDTIVLEAGATFVGPFVLPAKGGTSEILIRTSASDADLPIGVRVSPADAAKMPRLVASGDHVLRTAAGAGPYRFVGLEIAPASGVEMIDVVRVGTGAETSLDQLPHDIVFDRVYIHGDPVAGSRRGIAMNGVRIGVFNSYIADFKQTCCDSQALAAWNGPGPFTIVNNYLEAAGENVMFGGADPAIANLVPADIRVRGNLFSKPLRWKPDDPSYEGTNWVVKNLFELKNARAVVVDGNVFEHNWADDQNGFAILFTPRNQDGGSPWSVVEDVQFSNNEVRHVLSGINILGWDNLHESAQAKNVRIQNNVFWDVGGTQWGEGSSAAYGYGQGGWFLQLLDATADIVVEHNAVLATNGILNVGAASPAGSHTGERHTGFVFRHNIVRHGTLGSGPAATLTDFAALAAQFGSGTVASGNVVIGGPDAAYPNQNVRVASEDDVGFLDWEEGNLRLAASSPFSGAGADGHDVGYDADAFTSLGTSFTDASLTPRVHAVRAVHMTELRRRINDVRARYGLSPAVWTDPVLGGTIAVKTVHVSEMRVALTDVYTAIPRPLPAYTDATLVAGSTLIKAAHISELRDAVVAVE